MPTNHETIFLYCFQYSIAIPAGDGIAIGCIRHIITMAEIVSTSLTISAIFVCRVPWLVMKQLKNIAAVLSVFGGTNERKALSMAENYTNNTLILTFDGEYLTNDKDLFIAPDEIICYINTTGCRDQKIEEMKSIIASADWETFCAACECYNSHFTVSELIDFVNEMDEHFILLPHIHTLEDLGEFIFDKHWDSSKYAKIRYHINFESIGHDMVVAGEAAETTYGYMIMLW